MKNENQYPLKFLFSKNIVWRFLAISFTFLGITSLIFSPSKLLAQDFGTIKGIVISEKGELLSAVTIKVSNQSIIGQTNKDGYFLLNKVSLKTELTFSRLGYKRVTINLELEPSKDNVLNVTLSPVIQSLDEVFITEKFSSFNLKSIDFAKYSAIPQTSGSFESFIKNLPGVSGNNELSSQYSVRGGNFDENLVYLNNVEIYRPLLTRSGQQEGLGFINPSLSSNVYFSAGGFEARYGDRLSSILDVSYDKPDSLTIEAQAGLLLNSGTLKWPLENGFLLAGFRIKNNQTLLERQNVEGDYFSRFSDYQFLFKHNITSKFNFSFFTLYNQGKLQIHPKTRLTEFGTSDDVLRLMVNYSGQEMSKYDALNSAITFSYNPNSTLNVKWISSIASINENEDANLLGWYSFIDRGSNALNPVRNSGLLGAGSNHTFFNNQLKSLYYNTELKIYKQIKNSFLEIGTRFQTDLIEDSLDEFNATDTSTYSHPNTGNWIYSNVIDDLNNVKIYRFNAFIQNTVSLGNKFMLAAGVRFNYNNFSNDKMISPRLTLKYQSEQNDQLQLKFSLGAYNQAPFYRELKNYNGSLNLDVRAQKSFQFIAGVDYKFDGLGTRLKFSSEVYYKILSRITPYKIEDLKIRYLSDQTAKGYAAGADFSLSGNFAKDLESTFRFSILKTEENINNDFYFSKDKLGNDIKIEPGYLRRPTDQLFNIGMMFQDRLIQNPTYKVHLNVVYSSSLPIGPPGPQRHTERFKIPSYKRVDIGFSKDFVDPESKRGSVHIKKYFQSLSLHTELFNLFNFKNTTSYLWLNDKNERQYAVPNYLSARMFNLRLIAIIKNR